MNLGQRLSNTFDNVVGFVLGGLFIAASLVYLLVRDTWEKVKAGWRYLVDLGNPDSPLNKKAAERHVYYVDLGGANVASLLPVSTKPKKTRKKKTAPVEKSEEVTKRIKLKPSTVDEDINIPVRFTDVQPKKKKPGRPRGKKTKTV